MVQFHIQPDSGIPASKQLFDQIQFAIASRQFPPGHRLPSTRQLAISVGLHRNTISKVYHLLEKTGLVESQAGSGIYVKALKQEIGSPLLKDNPTASKLVQKILDDLLAEGYTLPQARELFLAEVDWRLRCGATVLVAVPKDDIGAGELMVKELKQALKIPIQLVFLEELSDVLEQTQSATVVTSRYFIGKAESISQPKSVRVIPVDIYDYNKELDLIKKLPKDSSLGVVSLSVGILSAAEILVHSLRGEDLLVITAQVNDTHKLRSVVRNCQTIIADPASYTAVQQMIKAEEDDLIRFPDVICSDNYIGAKSMNLLQRELGGN